VSFILIEKINRALLGLEIVILHLLLEIMAFLAVFKTENWSLKSISCFAFGMG
jgi:hypothetical protein